MKAVYLLASTAALIVSGCGASTTPPAATPVSTSTVIDSTGAAVRFTTDIWPAMLSYSTNPGQGSPATAALGKVIDPSLDPGARTSLQDSVLDLNIVQVADATHNQIGTENVHLGSATLTNETATDATLDICYTYTALTYGTSSDPQRAPGPRR